MANDARTYGIDAFEWTVIPLDDEDNDVLLKHPDTETELCNGITDALQRTLWAMEAQIFECIDDGQTMWADMLREAVAEVPTQ